MEIKHSGRKETFQKSEIFYETCQRLDVNVIALVKLQTAIQASNNARDVKTFRKILLETMLGVLYLTKFRDALLDELKQANNGAYRCLTQSLHDRPKELYSTLNGFKSWIDKLTASPN